MRTPIIAALLLAASVANAAPVYLSCSGHWVQGWIGPFQGYETIPISLDTDKGTLTYKDKTLKIYRNTNAEMRAADLVGDTHNGDEPVHAGLELRLNRLTGNIYIGTVPNNITGWRSFEGTCKPTQKLF